MSNPFYRVPDSELATKATSYVKNLSAPYLYNHVMRSYAYGYIVGERTGMKYDLELYYLGSLFHDIGFTAPLVCADGPFDKLGAQEAYNYLVEHEYPSEKAKIAQLAIELHTTLEGKDHTQSEVAMVSLGAMIDATGIAIHEIDAKALRYIMDAYPDVEANCSFIELFLYQYKKTNDVKFLMIAEAAKKNRPTCSHKSHRYDSMFPTSVDITKS
ncbi:hypothetical protein [Paenibacillus arenosi]|uniref:Phosphohydrolase n=1 Tax=Paenibacillus arenosi TaxID=2774142 RepID=A0ABR9B075_9BACL|nr:hypothetical protein [Paenibacillus arenosi]MBD8499728.1 hypothetical protein [Paenibacillus arenosi]